MNDDRDTPVNEGHQAPVEGDEASAGCEADEPFRRAAWWERLRLVAIVFGIVTLAWLLFTWLTWPDVASLRTQNPRTTAFIERYRETRREAGLPEDVAWRPVPSDSISVNLKRAVVASEDTEFFFHDGFSSHEMREALKRAIREREAPRGASTITQQLAKNLWLTPRKSLTRKLREAVLTKQLERELSKDRILELYLNVVEFGPGVYGAEAAARHFFGIPASRLSPRQGAMLAAGLPRPKTWNPSSGSDPYAQRVERILSVQRQLQYLDRYFGPEEPGLIRVVPPEVREVPRAPAGSIPPGAIPGDSSPLEPIPGNPTGPIPGNPIRADSIPGDRIPNEPVRADPTSAE